MDRQIDISGIGLLGFVTIACLFLAGCSPTIKVKAPKKPVEINLNVKIKHELRIKVDKDVDELIKDNPDLF